MSWLELALAIVGAALLGGVAGVLLGTVWTVDYLDERGWIVPPQAPREERP